MKLIRNQWPNADKIYLYIQDPLESKYQWLINGREKVGINKLKNLKAFIDYSYTIDDVYENLKDYDPTKKRKALKHNEKLSPMVTKLLPNLISGCLKL